MNPHILLAPPSAIVFSIRELAILWYEYEWKLAKSLSLCDYAEFLVSISTDFIIPSVETPQKVLRYRSRILEYVKELETLRRTGIIDVEERAALAYLNKQSLEIDTARLEELSKHLERGYVFSSSFEALRAVKVEKLRSLIKEGTSQTTLEAAQLMDAGVFAEDSRLLDLAGRHMRHIFLERRRVAMITTIWKLWLADLRKRLDDFSVIAEIGINERPVAGYHIKNNSIEMRKMFKRMFRKNNSASVESRFEELLDFSRQLLWMERSWSERMS